MTQINIQAVLLFRAKGLIIGAGIVRFATTRWLGDIVLTIALRMKKAAA